MSNYELKCLLENKLNKYKNRIKAREELMERGVLVRKKYKRDNNIKFEED